MVHFLLSKLKYAPVFFVLITSLFVPQALLTANLNDALPNLSNAGQKAGTNEAKIETVAGSVINSALSLVGLIFLILMVYGGFLWMTARGEEGQIEKAQKIITAAIIGLVVIMGAYAITYFVTSKLESAG